MGTRERQADRQTERIGKKRGKRRELCLKGTFRSVCVSVTQQMVKRHLATGDDIIAWAAEEGCGCRRN